MNQQTQKFNTYEEVCNYISKQHSVVYSLDHFKKFMHDFNDPQNKLKVIHVAGTNGKGSTTNYIASILQAHDYKVATFTSPALVSRLDVIRVNGIPILEKDIVSYANQYLDKCITYHLSQFEIEVFFSVLYFIDCEVDFCIYEVGLGGRLDATNIVSPIICAITNIGLDHTDYLGDSYTSIAKEKAGIIKDGIPVITGEKREDVLEVFKQVANENHTFVYGVNEPSNIKIDDCILFDYKWHHFKLNTIAKYQIKNAILAIEVIKHLACKQYCIFDDESVQIGLFNMHWPARFEIIKEHPRIILDGAHNKEGVEALVESLQPFDDIKILFSALKDKDTHHMLEGLLTITNDITITEFDHLRFGSVESLDENFNLPIEKDYKKWVIENLSYKGTILITGSLYFISQIRPFILSLETNCDKIHK